MRNIWKRSNLPLVITKYVQHGSMKDASHCKRNHQMKYSGCSCGCNGEWHTLQRQKKKREEKTSQILLKVRCGFRFAAGSQTRKDISRDLGNFPFGFYISQQIPFSVKQLQENLDLNTKEMGKNQFWSLHLPYFWSPDKGTTLTSAVHQMIWRQCYAFFLSFSFPKTGLKEIWCLLWKQSIPSDFLTNFLPWFMVMERSLKTFRKTSSLVLPSVLLEGLWWKN